MRWMQKLEYLAIFFTLLCMQVVYISGMWHTHMLFLAKVSSIKKGHLVFRIDIYAILWHYIINHIWFMQIFFYCKIHQFYCCRRHNFIQKWLRHFYVENEIIRKCSSFSWKDSSIAWWYSSSFQIHMDTKMYQITPTK